MGGLASKIAVAGAAAAGTAYFSGTCHTAKKATSAAASAAFVAITRAAEATTSYLAGLFGAAASATASAYGAVRSAAADASRSVVEFMKHLFGSEAATAATRKLEEVAHRPNDFLSAADSAVAALKAAFSDIVPISVCKAVSVPLELASHAASSALDVLDLVRSIPAVEKVLGLEIPTEAQIAIAVVAVAAAICCSPAAAAGGAMMKAPGGGGIMILRAAFGANPQLYFSILRAAGPVAAAASFV